MRRAALIAAAVLGAPIAAELRVRRAQRAPSERWRTVPVAPRGLTALGMSFRPLQAESLGLDPRAALDELLAHRFDVVRLAAYWNRIERSDRRFSTGDLDWQLDAAAAAGKRVLLCVGAVKAFGYPETFVPAHRLAVPIAEHALVQPQSHPELLAAAVEFVTALVERYRGRSEILGWQVEHEAVDPLGLEHSWRLSTRFLEAEIRAVRKADPCRPIVLNGFLPASLPIALHQRWRTRRQGDSLAVAAAHADIVGVDYYPRHALLDAGPLTVYLDGGNSPWPRWRFTHAASRARERGSGVMVSEGQAEPWEATTVPPSPAGRVMSSCRPEHLVTAYNRCMRWSGDAGLELGMYLFWGGEYWLRRQQDGDPRYLRAFERILAES